MYDIFKLNGVTKMKIYFNKYLAVAVLLFPVVASAGEWNMDAKGLVGGYYGVADVKTNNKYPNRLVFRGDANLTAEYKFDKDHRLGIYASTAVILKEDDKNRSEGEYRFYPYVADFSKYGEVYLGYTYNAAKMLHKGAKDITFLGIDDSNATYFLSNMNWDNGYKKVSHTTPKSTTILNDGRAAKFVYILPVDENTKVGFSYTPDNANRRGMTSRFADYEKTEDGYTMALQKKWNIGGWKMYNSLGYGIFNRTDKELSLGIALEKGGFNIATGYKKAYVDGLDNPIATQKINDRLPALFDNYRESEAWNISMGYERDKFATNVAYLNTGADNTRHQDNLLVWSNVYSITDNVEFYAAAAYLNFHGGKDADDDRGIAGISGLGLRF